MRRLLIYISVVVLILSSFIIVTPTTSAQAQVCDREFYATNDIMFYDPCDTTCTNTSASATIGGPQLPQDTSDYLDGRGIQELIKANKARYEYASKQTGVRWEAIAALHYREAGMNSGSSIFNGAPLGSGTNVDGQEVVSDPNEDAARAAQHFINMAKGVYGIDPSAGSLTNEDWANAFLAYNRGYLYKQNGKTFDQSPYVMNGYDIRHMNMSWVGPPADPAVSGVDGNKAGALTVMQYLGGISGSLVCAGSGAVLGDIVKTALAYTVDYNVPDGTVSASEANPAWLQAIADYNHPATYPQITDCGRFVSTVMRASGADPDYPLVSTDVQTNYMRNSSKWQSMGKIRMDEMQPGDVIMIKGHTMLYTGPNGDYVAADASFYQRIPSVRKAGSVQWMINSGHEVWRLAN